MSNTIPTEFYCPITLDIMKEPVIGLDGHTYEKIEIIHWLNNNNNKSPMTRQYMDIGSLIPNYALKSQIESYIQKNKIDTETKIDKFIENKFNSNIIKFKSDNIDYFHIQIVPDKDGERQAQLMFIILDNSGSMAELVCDVNESGGMAFTRMDLC